MKNKLYMGVAEAMERYGVSRAVMNRLFREPDCPSIAMLYGKEMIPVDEFDRFFMTKLEIFSKDE